MSSGLIEATGFNQKLSDTEYFTNVLKSVAGNGNATVDEWVQLEIVTTGAARVEAVGAV
jgi:hypothetical protein